MVEEVVAREVTRRVGRRRVLRGLEEAKDCVEGSRGKLESEMRSRDGK